MPAAAAAGPSSAAPSGGGGNPFQLATNLYCEKNNVGNLAATTVTTSRRRPVAGRSTPVSTSAVSASSSAPSAQPSRRHG